MINKKQQSGVGLIEVLVTALILGGSLMALTALQSRSLQYNHSAYMRSQANIIAYDAIDRLRTRSTPAQVIALSAEDLEDLASGLPQVVDNGIDATCDGNRVCRVSITWVEEEGMDDDGATTTFEYTTRI